MAAKIFVSPRLSTKHSEWTIDCVTLNNEEVRFAVKKFSCTEVQNRKQRTSSTLFWPVNFCILIICMISFLFVWLLVDVLVFNVFCTEVPVTSADPVGRLVLRRLNSVCTVCIILPKGQLAYKGLYTRTKKKRRVTFTGSFKDKKETPGNLYR